MKVHIGATSIHTALGNLPDTMLAMNKGFSGLHYSECFRMFAGTVDVCPHDGYTRFESLLIEQLDVVIHQSGLDVSGEDVRLVISSTKGNVDMLAAAGNYPPEQAFLDVSARSVAEHFGFAHAPLVVSNACISGLSALVVARNMLFSGQCRHIFVAGCDVLSEFITEGFASFKSISPNPCRPYDAERDGLTLGEACGAMLLTTDEALATLPRIYLAGGTVTNDANHISGPSRTGDGLYYAIDSAMKQAGVTPCDIAFINTHGTATRYNDEMESKAVAWAGLDATPLNSVKGYVGHTLGASGIVETIMCAEELRQGHIVGTKGFLSSDVPCRISVSAEGRAVEGRCCVKTASGFGGCNAAVVLDMEQRDAALPPTSEGEARVVGAYTLPRSPLPFAEFIRSEFKALGRVDMKFYKMSDMCKALYVAMERLLERRGIDDVEPTRRAIVLANRSASLDADLAHQRIVNQHLPAGASPAVFVYTLANVAAGEM